jgi:TonB family protein
MPRSHRSVFLSLAALIALTFLASESRSQVPEIVGQPRPGTIQDWLARLDLADKRLQEADHREARAIADKMIQEMLDRVEGGEPEFVGTLLGRTLVVRALGEAGLGHSQEATWDWFAAQAVQPTLTEAVLADHGPAGAALIAMIDQVPQIPSLKERENRKRQLKANKKKVTRPIKTWGGPPRYPKALRSVCTEGVVVMESVIDQAGKVNRPQLVKSPSPLLTLATMESWRTWLFKPATLEGQPVDVYYSLTMNFEMRACRNAAAIALKKRN